jgi:hypothetical protein
MSSGDGGITPWQTLSELLVTHSPGLSPMTQRCSRPTGRALARTSPIALRVEINRQRLLCDGCLSTRATSLLRHSVPVGLDSDWHPGQPV